MEYKKKGPYVEFEGQFEPGPAIENAIEPGRCYLAKVVDRQIQLKELSKETPGWRLRVGKGYLYLMAGQVAPDDVNYASKVLSFLLQKRIFYPFEQHLLNYWKEPTDGDNRKEDYADKGNEDRSRFLAKLIDAHCPGARNALEIGCNVGRNLNFLRKNKGISVGGIEINEDALHLMQKTYPDLRSQTFWQGSAPRVIQDIPKDAFDLVFSMAVFMHLHPKTPPSFWEQVMRVARTHIITIENERSSGYRHWQRDYGKIFTDLGCRQVYCETVPDTIMALRMYTVRVFSTEKLTSKISGE